MKEPNMQTTQPPTMAPPLQVSAWLNTPQPLSLDELIQLIETANSDELGPIGTRLLDRQWESGAVAGEELAGFLRVSSEFYSDLAEHYWFATQRWLARHRGRNAPTAPNR